MGSGGDGGAVEGAVPPFTYERLVRFPDVDAAGVVFFARYLEWFHDAYFAWLAANGIDPTRMFEPGGWGTPLVHAEADYQASLVPGDRVTISIVAEKIGGSSFTLGYRMEGAGAKLHATGRTIHVCVDITTRRPRPIPDELRALLASASTLG